MCSMIGVFTTGAMGLGISPVSGKSLVPLPAASAIAFTAGLPSAERPLVLYILLCACEHFTPALPLGQVRRTPEALHGLENRGSRRRPAGAPQRRGAGRGHREGPKSRRARKGAGRGGGGARRRGRGAGQHAPH